MKTLMLLVALLTAGPAWAVPLTFDFTGTIAFQYGTVDGSFTYENTAAPNATNVHGLATNVTYALTSWDFTVHNTFASIPSPYLVNFPITIAFSNLLANNTSEFCIGICIFSSQPFESLRFYSGEYFLQLEFEIPGAGPFLLTPPDTLEEWGTFSVPIAGRGGGSSFESPRVVALLTSGGMTGLSVGDSSLPAARVPESIPEPATWILLAGGLMGLLAYRLGGRNLG